MFKLLSRDKDQSKVTPAHDLRTYIPLLRAHPTPIDARRLVGTNPDQTLFAQVTALYSSMCNARFELAKQRTGLTTEQAEEALALKFENAQTYGRIGRVLTGATSQGNLSITKFYSTSRAADEYSGTFGGRALQPHEAREIYERVSDIHCNRAAPKDQEQQNNITRDLISIYLREHDSAVAHENRGFWKKLGALLLP
jgi:hypothetical protein